MGGDGFGGPTEECGAVSEKVLEEEGEVLIFGHVEEELPDLGSQEGCVVAVGANDVEA